LILQRDGVVVVPVGVLGVDHHLAGASLLGGYLKCFLLGVWVMALVLVVCW
jgi:hypothetical protein